jgi:hypothetical protein
LRVEAKYHLDRARAALFRDELLATGFVRDPHVREPDGYTVSSIYLDRPDLLAFEEKQDGLARRIKYRLRFYGEEPGPALRFEQKEKDVQLSWKRVDEVSWEDAQRFVRDFAGPLLECLDPRAGYVEPVVCVQYERLAFEHPVYEARINLDANLRWREVDPAHPTLLGGAVFEPLEPGQVIGEIKVPREYARDVADLVHRWDLHWRATSKYAICIAHRQRCLGG